MMAIRAYFDESEDKDATIHAIGGFIGIEQEWESLQDKWVGRVDPTGVTAYHMTDCECGYGEFSAEKGWNKEDRNQLTKDLIEIILRHKVFMLGAGLLLDDYKQIPPLDEKEDLLGGDKWLFPFQSVIQEAATQALRIPGNEAVAFFFDWREKKGNAQKMIEEFREDTRLGEWRRQLGTLTFGHKEFDVADSLPLLQVADIAARETAKAIENKISTNPHRRESFERLKAGNRVYRIDFFDKEVMQIMFELKREELRAAKSE
jgi:hypothetical protein